MNRETGYYWVRFPDEKHYEIALWDDNVWQVIGDKTDYDDRDFEKIDEKMIKHYPKD